MDKMKAIVIHKPGDVRIVEYDKPVPGPRDVVSRVVCSGICGTDLGIYSGKISFAKDGRVRYPARIGHEWSGVVDKVGSDVKGFKPGDRVVSDTSVSCGKCENCISGNFQKCVYGKPLGTVNAYEYGSFAEYIMIPDRHMHRLDDRISYEQGALIEPATIALSGIQSAGVNTGDTVLVTGTGAIGLAAVALAKTHGAKKVFIAGRRNNKLEIGLHLGADASINTIELNLADAVTKETNGECVDIIIETTGSCDIFDKSIDCLRTGGVVLLLGFYEDKFVPDFDLDRIVMRAINVKGPATPTSVRSVMDMMAKGKIDLSRLVTHIFPLEKGVEAFNNAYDKSGEKIKILIRMTD